MKVKIFSYNYTNDLEEQVNNFIKDKEVIDIKFEVTYSGTTNVNPKYSALVMYK